MKNELIQLLSEQVALFTHQNSAIDTSKSGVANDVAVLLAATQEENQESPEEEFESILVDFDFDIDEQVDFDIYMKIKYFWNDWNPILTDIY